MNYLTTLWNLVTKPFTTDFPTINNHRKSNKRLSSDKIKDIKETLLEDNGLTQEDIAHLYGVSPSTVSRINKKLKQSTPFDEEIN